MNYHLLKAIANVLHEVGKPHTLSDKMTATKLLSLHPVLAWIVYAVYLVLCQVYSLTPSPTAVLITLTGIVVWAYSNQRQP